MNILIEPLFIGFVQTLISGALISGVIFIGNLINSKIIKKYNHLFLDLLIGIIIISQFIKIFTYLGLFKEFSYFLSYVVLLAGIYNFKTLIISLTKNKTLLITKIDWIIISSLLLLFLISVAPPSMSDALNYHYGIPFYLIQHNELPDINTWLHSGLLGNGEMINSLALILGTDNFGSLIQFISLILFFKFLYNEINQKEKIIFIIIFIISSPTILQLISGAKFLLLPQLMTTTALYFMIKLKKIEFNDFIFIGILLAGATQFKLSFIISGFLIAILTFYRAFFHNKLKIIFYSILLFIFFFIPTSIWNYNHINSFNLINIFTIIPNEMIESLKLFRENNSLFPLNLFIPDSFGKITAILGFQFLLLFFFSKKTKEFHNIILIVLFTACLHFFLGMNVSRIYFEFILWLAVSIIFINDIEIKYKLYTKILLPQLLFVFCSSLYFAIASSPSIFSNKLRDNFMIKNSFHYEAFKWINETLPKDAKVLSGLRSVAFLENEFVTNEPLQYNLSSEKLKKYFKLIKKNKINYIIIGGKTSKDHRLQKCIDGKYAESKKFNRSRRNPFNRNSNYVVSIYKFNYKKLPNCAN